MVNSSNAVGQLKKSIGAGQFFTLSFAAIVGGGWIVVLGDWLGQSGPLGAITAFLLASIVMMLVGLCYAELVTMISVSGGEIAYAYEMFGLKTSFITGWFLVLVYIATTSFEAISTGWIAGILFPGLRGQPLYTVRGAPVVSGSLILSLGATVFLTILNYRSTNSSAKFQSIFTYAKLGISVVFVTVGLAWGKIDNLRPFFPRTGSGIPWNGILGVFVTATFWLAGFNVVSQMIEEKKQDTSYRMIAAMLLLSIGAASLFYCFLILCCSMAMPWRDLLTLEFPAVGAFKAAFHSSFWAKMVLLSGLLGLFATWNSFFIAASRTLFALGRARIIHPIFARVHPAFGTPTPSILFVGVISGAGVVLGRGAIVPIVNMVSGCFVLMYLLVAVGVIRMRQIQPNRMRPYRIPGGVVIPVLATLASLFMLFESFYLPYANGDGQIPLEWILFIGWAVVGVVVWSVANGVRADVSESERRKLILGCERGAPALMNSPLGARSQETQ
jgi:amino acid transporter